MTESPLDEYKRLTIDLHALIALGLDESPEADAIREQMDGPLYKMDSEGIRLANKFSGDCYEAVRCLELGERIEQRMRELKP